MRVRCQPNSSCCGIKGIFGNAQGEEYLQVKIRSVPEKGKANRELLIFLAEILNVPRSALEIGSGENDRYKKIIIHTELPVQRIEKLAEDL